MTILLNDFLGKPLQHQLVRYIAHEVLPLLLVDDADVCSSFLKLFDNTTSDALSTPRHDGYFILEFFHQLNIYVFGRFSIDILEYEHQLFLWQFF